MYVVHVVQFCNDKITMGPYAFAFHCQFIKFHFLRIIYYPQKLSINGDLEYLKQNKKCPSGHIPVYISTYTTTKPTDEDDDVEPLPLNIDIIPTQSKI